MDIVSSDLSAKQCMFIDALLSGKNVAVAGKIASVSERTARRWYASPEVRQAYQTAQSEAFNESLTAIKLSSGAAVETLVGHMTAEATPAGSQIRAAQIILELAIEVHKMSELEQKIADLERRLEEPK